MIEAGRLRHRVLIQRQVQTQDDETGAVTVTWQSVAMVWAAIEPLSAREFMAAQTTQAETVARIVIRYRTGLDTSMRILHKSNVYNIQGLLPDKDSGLDYITIPVSRGVNDGQ